MAMEGGAEGELWSRAGPVSSWWVCRLRGVPYPVPRSHAMDWWWHRLDVLNE